VLAARRGAVRKVEQWAQVKRAVSDVVTPRWHDYPPSTPSSATNRPWYDQQRPDLSPRLCAARKPAVDPARDNESGVLIDPLP